MTSTTNSPPTAPTRLPPAGVVKVAGKLRTALQALTRRMVPSEVGLLELASGFMATHALYAMAELRIADALIDGPRTADEVAAERGTDPDATFRLLRACASLGVLAQHRDGRFALTPLSNGLRSDIPDSMLPVVEMLGDPRYQEPWGKLAHTVRTGRPAAADVFGMPIWDYLDANPDFAGTLNNAMTRLTALDWPAVAAAYDFTRFPRIADIGGGHGELLALILWAHPAAEGILVEREALIDDARERLRQAGVLPRCRLEAGSFFDSVPTDADLYVVRRVVHDFDDEPATALLANLRRHMPPGATLLLMESVVPPDSSPHFAKALDLDMMIFVDGRERTEQQFVTLLDRAGFHLTRIVPTISPISLIEAVPSPHP